MKDKKSAQWHPPPLPQLFLGLSIFFCNESSASLCRRCFNSAWPGLKADIPETLWSPAWQGRQANGLQYPLTASRFTFAMFCLATSPTSLFSTTNEPNVTIVHAIVYVGSFFCEQSAMLLVWKWCRAWYTITMPKFAMYHQRNAACVNCAGVHGAWVQPYLACASPRLQFSNLKS